MEWEWLSFVRIEGRPSRLKSLLCPVGSTAERKEATVYIQLFMGVTEHDMNEEQNTKTGTEDRLCRSHHSLHATLTCEFQDPCFPPARARQSSWASSVRTPVSPGGMDSWGHYKNGSQGPDVLAGGMKNAGIRFRVIKNSGLGSHSVIFTTKTKALPSSEAG